MQGSFSQLSVLKQVSRGGGAELTLLKSGCLAVLVEAKTSLVSRKKNRHNQLRRALRIERLRQITFLTWVGSGRRTTRRVSILDSSIDQLFCLVLFLPKRKKLFLASFISGGINFFGQVIQVENNLVPLDSLETLICHSDDCPSPPMSVTRQWMETH